MDNRKIETAAASKPTFFNRDLSWLSFNERVLLEAADESVPLLERMNFLSIFSSNLDEFYRVRMPAVLALHNLYNNEKIEKKEIRKHEDVALQVKAIIHRLQNQYGSILRHLVHSLREHNIHFIYDEPIPKEIGQAVTNYFFTQVLAYLKPVVISQNESTFFPENNKLYLVVQGETRELVIVSIPTEHLSRFFTFHVQEKQHVVFLDDIIKVNLEKVLQIKVQASYSFKVTRDAELFLDDVYEEDMALKIEKEIAKRDFGFATRLLIEPDVPKELLKELISRLGLAEEVVVEGGRYHNLKDINSLPVHLPAGKYTKRQPVNHPVIAEGFLINELAREDFLMHTPFHAYDSVLRFFNEAAILPDVEHIFTTMYRVASDSKILNALLSAAHNGKKVTVLIELKARFDEANNIKWAKKLKKAGVQVLYTPNNLKVHAKVALVKRKTNSGTSLVGLLATGNLNETTALFYTDHILLTGHQGILKEIEALFYSFIKKEKEKSPYNHLLVAQNNLQEKFLSLIDREIVNASEGLPARIIIKLNNLEERVLIKKLYEASSAGVQIQLIVRGICCLVPGIEGMSENITVRRIVDRYLEHGRIYVFHNNGRNDIILGSADWMNRNIYHRIEVCFPIYQENLKKQLLEMLELQLKDNVSAVKIDSGLSNVRIPAGNPMIRSQEAIYQKLTCISTEGAGEK